MITFDKKGYVFPYNIIEIDLSEFEDVFVKNRIEMEHRKLLFSKYLKFVEEFQKAIKCPFS